MLFDVVLSNAVTTDVITWGTSVGTAVFVSFGYPVCVYAAKLFWHYIQSSLANHERSIIRQTIAVPTTAIILASIARSIAGSPVATHQFHRAGLFSWKAIPLLYEQMGHTTYNIFVNGFRTEALADTGAWLNLVSESYLQRNPGPWIIVPDQYQLRVGNGKECRLSGYVQAMIRVGDSEELNQITLYIIDGLLFDVVLGHKFLNTTGMVQFSPGGTKRVYIHSTGSSQPNNAMILAANLADVRGPPLLQRMKMCFGLGRRPPSADARAVLESFNLRQREREERVPYCNTSGAMIDLLGAPILHTCGSAATSTTGSSCDLNSCVFH